jgi:hypothetical protein
VDNEPAKRVDLRVSDADRERVVEVLRDAFAEGRLSVEEHAERVDAAYAAKTAGELVPLTEDLPVHQAGARPEPAPAPAPLPEVAGENANLVAVFGGATRKGRWRAGSRLRAIAVFGGVEIDLTETVFEAPELVIYCTSVFGGVSIRVPEGVTLHGGGAGIFGGFDVRQEEAEQAGAPVVRVIGAAVFGGVDAKVKRGKLLGQLGARLRKQLGPEPRD